MTSYSQHSYKEVKNLMKAINTKRGQLGNLQGIILTLVVVGILVGAGFFILGEFMDQTVTLGQPDTTAGINDTITALETVPDLLPLVVLIAMIVIILALVFTIPGSRSGA